MTAQLGCEQAEQPTIIYNESGFPIGEAVAQHPATAFLSMGKCAHELDRVDREGDETVPYAAIQVFASESSEFLAGMKSVNLEHIGRLVSSFVSCAQATGCSIDVHLEIHVRAQQSRESEGLSPLRTIELLMQRQRLEALA
jgi:hypothetical protein